MAYIFVSEKPTLAVIISGEFVVQHLSLFLGMKDLGDHKVNPLRTKRVCFI
jgi:hypothetical protein